jgi:protein involved in sex pheromone biosynthesis
VRLSGFEVGQTFRVLPFFVPQILEHTFQVEVELGGVSLASAANLFYYFVPDHYSSPISSSDVHSTGIS